MLNCPNASKKRKKSSTKKVSNKKGNGSGVSAGVEESPLSTPSANRMNFDANYAINSSGTQSWIPDNALRTPTSTPSPVPIPTSSTRSIPTSFTNPPTFSTGSIPTSFTNPPTFFTGSIPASFTNLSTFSTGSVPTSFTNPLTFFTCSIPTSFTNPSTFSTSSIPTSFTNPPTFSTSSIPTSFTNPPTFSTGSIPTSSTNPISTSATAPITTPTRATKWVAEPVVFDSKGRIVLRPDGDNYLPWEPAKNFIGSYWRELYDGPWPSWNHFPEDMKNTLWDEFKGKFSWNPDHDAKMRSNFWALIARKIQCAMFKVRNHKGGPKKPPWISEEHFPELLKYFKSTDFKKMSKQNSDNRKSDPYKVRNDGKAPCTHRAGSISFGESRRRFTLLYGKDPSFEELYKWNHYNETEKKWKEIGPHKRWERYEMSLKEYIAGLPPNSPPPTTVTCAYIYVKSNQDKNGKVAGFGSSGPWMRQMAGLAAPKLFATSSEQMDMTDERFKVLAERFLEMLNKGVDKGKAVAEGDEENGVQDNDDSDDDDDD